MIHRYSDKRCAEAVENTEALALATAKNGGTSGLIEADCAKDG